MSFRSQPRFVSALALTAFCAIAVLPVVLMFVRYGSPDSLLSLDERQATLLGRSLAVASGSALVALALGAPIGVILARGATRLRLPLAALAIAPLFIPPYVLAGAWISVLDPASWVNGLTATLFGPDARISIFSASGAAWCLGVSFFPIVTGLLATGLATADRELEDAARLSTGRWGVLRYAVLPQVKGHILVAALLVLLFSLVRYDVPSLLGVNTYPVEIFSQFSAFYDTEAAVSMSVPLTVTALIVATAAWAFARTLRRSFESGMVVFGNRSASSWAHRLVLTFALALMLGITVYGPLSNMATNVRSFDVLQMAAETAGGDVFSTAMWAASAATLALLVAVPLGTCLSRTGGKRGLLLSILCWLPVAVPGTVVGLGILTLSSDLRMLAHGDTLGLRLVLAYTAMFLPFAVFITAVARDQATSVVDEIAALDGAGWLQRFVHIGLPLRWPAFLAAWMLVFALSTGELNATVLLVPPGRSTLAVTIDNLLHYGANPVATVLCLIVAGMGVAPLLIAGGIWYFVRRRPCGTSS